MTFRPEEHFELLSLRCLFPSQLSADPEGGRGGGGVGGGARGEEGREKPPPLANHTPSLQECFQPVEREDALTHGASAKHELIR